MLMPFSLLAQSKRLPRNYTSYFTSDLIVIDGKIDDKAWQNVPWSDNFVDIATAVRASDNLSTRFKMLWDKQYLYIAACLGEPAIWGKLTKRDAIIYKDNDFEVFIDPDGDGLNYYELEINALGTVMDLFLKKPYNKGGKANLAWNLKGLRSAVAIYGTVNQPIDTDSRWTVEIAIPRSAFKEKNIPVDGDIWRVNFSRVEWPMYVKNRSYLKQKNSVTGKNLPERNWVWSPQGVVNMHIPDKWGFVKFVKRRAERTIPKFWVWSGAHHNWSDEKWQTTLKKLSNAGITGLLLSADTATLHKVALLANCFGIQVHAWFVTMNYQNAPPEWLSVNEEGKSLAVQKAYVTSYKFMSPGLPAVRNYLKTKIASLLSVKGLSGIHFDFIRYVDVILPKKLQPKYGIRQRDIMPAYDYGYHPYMRKLYKDKYGIDPLKLADPLHDTSWLEFRLKVLDTTVMLLRNQIEKAGLITSAAVFPTPKMARRMVRQDWGQWHLNYYFPMIYNNFYGRKYRWIKKVTEEDEKAVGENSKVFSGLFLPALKKGNRLTKAMKAAFKGGADGIAFFNLNALNNHLLRQIVEFQHQKNKK
ncbi:MAG: hypothetical protein IEMM0006_2027 [bacterium]|nr:MAG: hypothetical protein IEMM0006_2027 [bacterium]